MTTTPPGDIDHSRQQGRSEPNGLIPLSDLAALAEAAREHRERRIAPATKRYHQSDWAMYERWCEQRGLPALPVDPRLVSLYITDLARLIREDGTWRFKASSLRRHVSSIARKHYESGGGRGLGQHEAISDVMNGISIGREEGPTRKRALLLKDIVALVNDMDHATWPFGVTAARDRFAILLGFAAALRSSEAAALTNGQVVYQHLDGIHVRLGRTKTDQAGLGATLPVPFGQNPVTCVPCAWVRWNRLVWASERADRMRLVRGTGTPQQWEHVCRGSLPEIDPATPLLRTVTKGGGIGVRRISGSGLNGLLKRRLSGSGYDETLYGYHSLRAGFVTQTRRNGADTRAVRRQTRHRSDAMVDVYDREHNPLQDNAVTGLGL